MTKTTWREIAKWIGIILLIILVLVLGLVLFLTITEYKPAEEEVLEVQQSEAETIDISKPLTIMTWNTGYGALGENADFFMDGGAHVSTADKDEVLGNLEGIADVVNSVNPDIVLLQEVDKKSKRSHYVDEEAQLAETIAMNGAESFAYNYKTYYVPYPLPTIGRVEAGLMTMSRYSVEKATRLQLPCPFSYPIRLANLKRCVMIDRIAIPDSDRELVIINLHLEAYDSGEGKIEQTNMLRKLLTEEAAKGNYVIAGGDFNQEFSNADTSGYPQISEDLWMPGTIDVTEFGDDFTFVTDDTNPSCRSLDQPYAGSDRENFQYYLIDGFIVSGNVNVETINTLDLGFVSTDHNPVVMQVTFD